MASAKVISLFRVNFYSDPKFAANSGKHYTAKTLKGTESRVHIREEALKTNPNFSITTVVTESEDAGVALKALRSAFESNKDALKTEFEKLFKEAVGVDAK